MQVSAPEKPPELQIREADAGAAGELALLRSLSSGEQAAEADFERRMTTWFTGEGRRRTTWLAELDGRPAGMVSLFEYRRMPRPRSPDSCWGYLGNLFVREELRGRGIGTALVAAVTTEAERRRYVRLVLSPSEPAVELFRRAGFVEPGAGSGQRLLVRPGSSRP